MPRSGASQAPGGWFDGTPPAAERVGQAQRNGLVTRTPPKSWPWSRSSDRTCVQPIARDASMIERVVSRLGVARRGAGEPPWPAGSAIAPEADAGPGFWTHQTLRETSSPDVVAQVDWFEPHQRQPGRPARLNRSCRVGLRRCRARSSPNRWLNASESPSRSASACRSRSSDTARS